MAARVQSRKQDLTNHEHRGAQNLVPNGPGERRGGRQEGTPNKLTRLLKDAAMRGLDEAGDYLLRKAEIEEEEAIEQAKENGDEHEVWRRAKALRQRIGGAAGYFAWAALEDPAAMLGFLKGILPIQLRETGTSVSHTETSVDGTTRTTVTQRLTSQQLQEQLAERGLVLPNLIDVTPHRPKNASAEDPNPMVEQGGEVRPLPGREEE